MAKGMHTIVSNGEPVVYASACTGAYQHLVQSITGEWPETGGHSKQTQVLIQQSWKEVKDKIPLNISARGFSFISTECCAEDAAGEKHGSAYTVEVQRKSKWGPIRSTKRIQGCRCGRCNDNDKTHLVWAFLREVQSVKFEI